MWSFFLSFYCLTACASHTYYAPVVDGWAQPLGKQGYHFVREGETLYSIAWEYGLDHRVLAKNNHLKAPYTLHAGDKLSLVSYTSHEEVTLKQVKKPPYETPSRMSLMSQWQWPAQGIIIQDYESSSMGNKGIDITGHYGSDIKAAASGTVVYSGNGIRSYGNLLIIKHDALYLSAYGHNKQLFVQEGQKVKQGEKIATMGHNQEGKTVLHFEIRRAGKPVNPHDYLGKIHK